MLNTIWVGMILFSYLFSFFTGTTEAVTSALFAGAEKAVTLVLSLLGMMCFWTGLLEVANRAGITGALEKLFAPVMRFLFPGLKNEAAIHAIVMSIAANFLGLANAATPLGIAAMRELETENLMPGTATDPMCMFAVINSAAVTLLPLTLFTLRAASGSTAPFEVLLPVWVCSLISVLCGVFAAKYLKRREKY